MVVLSFFILGCWGHIVCTSSSGVIGLSKSIQKHLKVCPNSDQKSVTLAIRSKYVADNIRPLMYKMVGEDDFVPETMSTSYVARTIFEDVRNEFPDYIIKFSSDNPRNPANQA